MKKLYTRFTIGLMAFALGLAAVYTSEGLRTASEVVPVKLPEAGFGDVLAVSPATRKDDGPYLRCGDGGRQDNLSVERAIVEDRDMRLYEDGGHYIGEGYYPEKERSRVRASIRAARQFIWSHWQQKKRGYLSILMNSVDAGSDAHIFIEPDQNGEWQITWYWQRLHVASCPADVDKMSSPIRSIRFIKATEDDWDFRPGTRFLQMTDEDGHDFLL